MATLITGSQFAVQQSKAVDETTIASHDVYTVHQRSFFTDRKHRNTHERRRETDIEAVSNYNVKLSQLSSLCSTISLHAQRLDLFAWCVRLSRLLVGFRTHFKSLHFHSFIHSFIHARNVMILMQINNVTSGVTRLAGRGGSGPFRVLPSRGGWQPAKVKNEAEFYKRYWRNDVLEGGRVGRGWEW